MKNKCIIFVIIMILFGNILFAVDAPSNKSPNGIIEWVDDNFVATDSWTASGSTQIYTEKSVGIGTSTPDVDYKLFVDGISRFLDTLIVDGPLLVGTTVDDGVNKVQVNGGVTTTNLRVGQLLTLSYGTLSGLRFYSASGFRMYSEIYGTDVCLSNNKALLDLDYYSGVLIATTTGRTEAEELQINGHAYVKNYVKQANSMAMIDMTENTTGQVIPVSTDWTELTFTNGDDHYAVGDCIASATNNCIQILATGVYDIRVESSFYCNDRSTQWKFNALVDGESSHAGFVRFTSNSNDVGCAMGSGIVVVATAPAIITVGVQHNESSTSTLTCYRTALIVKYLGEIQ